MKHLFILFAVCVVGQVHGFAEEAAWLPSDNVQIKSDLASDHEGFYKVQIRGWTFHLNQKLCADTPVKMKTALQICDQQLTNIIDKVPAKAVSELKKVHFWVNPPYEGTQRKAEYHPGAAWLKKNGRNTAMERNIEITNVAIFEAENRRMPWVLLHELAHAYHHRVLGFDQPEIAAAYKAARRSGTYDRVTRWTGRKNIKDVAYAVTNDREYFAESTEAYFGRNDFFPFDRKELTANDPEMARLVGHLWGAE